MTVDRDVENRVKNDHPCQKERSLSMACLDNNGYDYTKCESAFDNFKMCLQFWNKVKTLRVQQRIKPPMPLPEERAEIRRVFLQTGKLPDYSNQEK